jgi:hypothetical protein
MGIKYKVGAQVRQVVPVISGEVVGVAIVDGEVSFEVAYIGADGEPHSRFFGEDEIEAVDVPVAPE